MKPGPGCQGLKSQLSCLIPVMKLDRSRPAVWSAKAPGGRCRVLASRTGRPQDGGPAASALPGSQVPPVSVSAGHRERPVKAMAKVAALIRGVLLAELVAGYAAGASGPAPASVPACIAFGVRVIRQRRTPDRLPPACSGLSRAEVNLALGRAIYLAAGSHRSKAAWRRDAPRGRRPAGSSDQLAAARRGQLTHGRGGRPGARSRRPGPPPARPGRPGHLADQHRDRGGHAGPAVRPRGPAPVAGRRAAILPVAHGLAAMATMLIALLTALGAG
jgi:hypothetical protein